jgi:hypothetical protein
MVEALAVIGAVVVALILANLVVSRAFGVSLLCHVGIHRWHRVLVGQGRDTRYVVKCKSCEALKDEM